MLATSLSVALGLLFLLCGGAAVCLIFDASRRSQNLAARERRIRAHRIAGYLFIALFFAMSWLMILRARDAPQDLSPSTMLHILLAMVLVPLLFVKVLVARYYKSYSTVLAPLGMIIFTLAFVLIASTAGPYLFRKATVRDISLETLHLGAARIDVQASESLMQQRCSRCHTLDRVVGARKDAPAWLGTINRMRMLPGSGISDTDARIILSYLISENSIDSSSQQGELTVGKALVDSHCNRCHALDRTYQAIKTADEWRTTVERMVTHARGTEGFFKPGEDQRIIRFLSLTQSPEAMQAGPAHATAPLENERERAGTNRAQPGGHQPRDPRLPTIAAMVLIAVVFGTLSWRRPKAALRLTPAGATSASAVNAPPATIAAARSTLILQLVRIERQTHDCVTLRFRIAGLRAKPGQFLTFDWLLDGQKLVRSYSISSSPMQVGYAEITVKKQPEGRVSAFLNERISLGLTVEARGPSGRFCFDEISTSGSPCSRPAAGLLP